MIRKKNWMAVFLLILAVGFMLLGYHRGEVFVIFQKSIHVCLECIGIG